MADAARDLSVRKAGNPVLGARLEFFLLQSDRLWAEVWSTMEDSWKARSQLGPEIRWREREGLA